MYGVMLSQILNELEEKNGEYIYRTGIISHAEFRDIVNSGRFADEINDGVVEKRISMKRFAEYYDKYDYFDLSAIISTEEGCFKLYIDEIAGNVGLPTVFDHKALFESFKKDTLDTFPGASSVNINYLELPFGDRIDFKIKLSGMNALFPESVYINKNASYHKKMNSPVPVFKKILMGRCSVDSENSDDSVTWLVIYADEGSNRVLLVTENKVPIDCDYDLVDEQINKRIAEYMTDWMFPGCNWWKERIERMYVADSSELRGYTEFYEMFSEREMGDDGCLNAHVCCLCNWD